MCLIRTQVHCTVPIKNSNYPLSIFFSGSAPALTCFDELQHDLNKISVWANQWRLRFNPNITKQAVEVIFSTKTTPPPHPSLMFNNIPVKLVNEHKHLGIILDKHLSFTIHINSKLSIACRGLGIISRLRKYLPRITLELVFKTFIRPHLV